MSSTPEATAAVMAESTGNTDNPDHPPPTKSRLRRWLGRSANVSESTDEYKSYRPKNTMGILSDKETDEVPGKRQTFCVSRS